MCGLVAIISPSVPIRDDLLAVMRDRLIHRGPDNGSNWLRPNRRVGLAHRRLSIIDTSHSADQPMTSEDGALRIVFNGEIYNYLELRSELELLGIRFRTRSDTEVLLAALREWGEGALPRARSDPARRAEGFVTHVAYECDHGDAEGSRPDRRWSRAYGDGGCTRSRLRPDDRGGSGWRWSRRYVRTTSLGQTRPGHDPNLGIPNIWCLSCGRNIDHGLITMIRATRTHYSRV